jgi:HTH-type transcriptional repressor of NAD biosynthesis genes
MMQMDYDTALVVGKFCPLHKGHEYLINAAAAAAERVVILSYTSRDLGFPAAVRDQWLTQLYGARSLSRKNKYVIIVLDDCHGVPDDDAPDIEHREFCYRFLNERNLIPDVVFSSELYGDGFADHLAKRSGKPVAHVCLDVRRDVVPISATMLRKNKDFWPVYTSSVVRADMPRGHRILFIGGESSGKTTICRRVSELTGHPWVHEYGRELYEAQGNHVDLQDMVKIGREQIRREDEAASFEEYVFCDTSPLVTRFYSEKWFNECDGDLRLMSQREYDKVYFCNRDFDFVDDGARNGETFSDEQALYYAKFLRQRGVRVIELYGSIEERAQRVLETYED